MSEISPYILDAIRREMTRAEEIHPNYPMDPLRQTALMCEEAGEALKEAINLTRPRAHNQKRSRQKLRREVIQTAVMAIRMLITMDYEEDV